MNESEAEPKWLSAGIGTKPELRWTFATDAALVDLASAREGRQVVAADASGGIYLLDGSGQLLSVTRGFASLSALAISDVGGTVVAAVGDDRLCWCDRRLKVLWSVSLPDAVLAVAVDPYGHYAAASLANGKNHVFDAHKTRISRFETIRPLGFIQFLAARRGLVGAADYGLLCSHSLDGEEIWSEQLWSTVGDLTVTGDGRVIYLAGFSHGVQAFDGEGANRGSYVVEGTPSHVATSFAPHRLAVTTLERHFYWLDSHGELLWATSLPDDACRVRCDPLGDGVICGLGSGRLLRLHWNSH